MEEANMLADFLVVTAIVIVLGVGLRMIVDRYGWPDGDKKDPWTWHP